jgi:hypothetical protein
VVNLGPLNATGGIGTFNNTGGTVNITGTIDNTGNTIVLNNSTGSWTLAGGTLSGGTVNFAAGTSLIATTNTSNLLTGVTINGDLNLTAVNTLTRIGLGTTFATAHLANQNAELGFLAGATMNGTIVLEGAAGGSRFIGMSTIGSLTIGGAGVIRTNTGLGGNAQIGIGNNYFAAMTLTNNGLISSQVSGRTLTINPASFTNGATGRVEATGGGIVTREENREILRGLGFVVWLTASEDVIFDRVSRNKKRPLLHTANPRETVHNLLTERRHLYEAVAQCTLDTTALVHESTADTLIAEARRAFSWDSGV